MPLSSRKFPFCDLTTTKWWFNAAVPGLSSAQLPLLCFVATAVSTPSLFHVRSMLSHTLYVVFIPKITPFIRSLCYSPFILFTLALFSSIKLTHHAFVISSNHLKQVSPYAVHFFTQPLLTHALYISKPGKIFPINTITHLFS